MVIKRPIRAVLFDVDGTLYHQRVLRSLMAFDLSLLPLAARSYRSAYRTWRILTYFRRVREELRQTGEARNCQATLQYMEAAQRSGEEPGLVEAVVTDWIYQRPLKYLKFCRRRGLAEFLTYLQSTGKQVGVFSDYPSHEKLRALGLAEQMSLELCATDPAINAFKPHPKGFLHACTIWGLSPEEVLYIGDRPQVDAVGAARAGMPCAILATRAHGSGHAHARRDHITLSSFKRLQHEIARS